MLLEICVDSAAGVDAAIAGGADRIELCAALGVGGLTPSTGLVRYARAATRRHGVALFAMVRPREGDFAYDARDLNVAIEEGAALAGEAVDGLVFGAARAGHVDAEAAIRWLDAVRAAAGRTLPCTFHRAIDLVGDPVAAVRLVASLGFDRILSSGGARSAPAGKATLAAMVQEAGDAIVVMPGSSIRPDTIAEVHAATGAREWHASASTSCDTSDRRVTNLGFSGASERRTDVDIVRQLKSALTGLA